MRLLPLLLLLVVTLPARAAVAPVLAAVVDSGVDPSVPGIVGGYNAVDGSSFTADVSGHGTGVAQVVAATCGGCRIMPVRIADDTGSSTQGTIAAGVRWASDHGAQVINLSWGLAVGGRSTGQVERAIAGAVAHGATVTVAAMNDGSRDPNLDPWASRSPGAVRVGAVGDDGRLVASSNHGVWVDVGAHGSATSNAAPRVAGAAAIVLAAHPKLTPAQVRAALRRGCEPAPTVDVGWHCLLDVDGAVKAAESPVAVHRLLVSVTGRGVVGGSGAEIQCGEFCSDHLDAGTTVTLTAAPIRGNRFVRWAGTCRGTRPACVIRMTGPATATAVFGRK